VRWCKLVTALALAAAVAAFFVLDLGRFLTLDALRGAWVELDSYYRAYPVRAAAFFFVAYAALAALALPGAAALTLAAGAVFGLVVGTVVVACASASGAVLGFLLSRFLLRSIVQRRFGRRLEAVNRIVDRDGAYYLFALRLLPGVPHGLVNLVMGLTSMRAPTFYLVTQVGVLPACAVYVNAGAQLASLESLGGIVSPGLMVSLSLLGMLPLVARSLSRIRRRALPPPP
jgi:uncharacterized membrane protein YdjX (TVP38/TMEM64 family)